MIFPDGSGHRVDPEGGFATPEVSELGFYVARWEGGVMPFAVNLLDERESDLRVGGIARRGIAPVTVRRSSELWRSFLFLSFLLLCAEWLYEGRRHRRWGNSGHTGRNRGLRCRLTIAHPWVLVFLLALPFVYRFDRRLPTARLRRAGLLRLAALAVLVVALTGPCVAGGDQERHVVLALDYSESMAAHDFRPKRH